MLTAVPTNYITIWDSTRNVLKFLQLGYTYKTTIISKALLAENTKQKLWKMVNKSQSSHQSSPSMKSSFKNRG